MNKIYINEESEEFKAIKEEWYEQCEKIDNTDDLLKFINHLLNDYGHDYGTVVHAITAMTLATAWMSAHIEGITGFQAGFVLWGFIKQWSYKNNKVGLKLINYDDMLYPQYEYRFEKTIGQDRWEHLQSEARNMIVNENDAHPNVMQHWKSIVEGKVPFGYEVKRNDE